MRGFLKLVKTEGRQGWRRKTGKRETGGEGETGPVTYS